MIENEMEYRGSKSYLNFKYVKEQRVDGSWHFSYSAFYVKKAKCLRCTLMGIERYYQVKNLSNHINTYKKYISTTHKPNVFALHNISNRN